MAKKFSRRDLGGLEVTAPVSEPESTSDDEVEQIHAELLQPEDFLVGHPVPEHQAVEPLTLEEFEEPLPMTVSADVSRDPNATVAAVLICIGRLYEDAGVISKALSKHIPVVAAEPELHSFLQRMQISIGDFRHSVEQIERSMSDRLSEAIQQAVA